MGRWGGINKHILQIFHVSLFSRGQVVLLKGVILQILEKQEKVCLTKGLLTNGEGEVSVFPWFVKTSILKREGGKAVFFIKNDRYGNLLLIITHMASHTAVLTTLK